MDEAKVRELETAAQILMNPQMVTNDVRLASENMIMSFRKTKAPYAMCQHILNTTKNDYLQFEAAGLIKNNLISEWDSLSDAESLELRQYLINFVMGREDAQQYVRERVLQVVAIITKRRAIRIDITELLNSLAELEAIFQNGNDKQQYLACRVVDTLMQEFQITIKSDDSGLTFEDHFKAKKLFEATALMKIFVTITTPIKRLLSCFDANNPTIVVLLGEYMRIMETILSWGFTSPLLPKRLIGLFESACKFEQSPPLRLGIKWEGVILDPQIMKLFFDIYWKVRDLKDVQRRGAICLVQLSTVYGSIMIKKENKLQFFANYFENYLQLISNIDIRAEEAMPLSQIARTIMNYNHYPGMSDITAMLSKILEPMFAMTCKFAEGSVHEELTQSEETVFTESFTNMLEAWLTILHDIPNNILHPVLQEIFNKYLQCHLSPPDGIYAITALESDEITETEVKDRDKFKEQLTIIGAFGREIPGHALPLLAKLLEEKIRRLRGQLLRIHSNGGDGGSGPDGDSKILDALYEDIHWLLLITGHVLCKDYEGEEPLMSSEIVTFCIAKADQGSTDMNTSLKLLASPTQCISEFPNAEHSTDLVVRLISAVFRLCEIEKNAIAANMSAFMSPEVSSTIMWFLKFWAEGYLLPPVSYYNKIPDALRESFGKDTAGGAWTVNFLLNKIYINVQSFTGEEQIVDDSIKLLVSMVKKDHKCSIVVNAENFKLILGLKDLNLPMRVKCGLLEGLVLAASYTAEPHKYLSELIHPICVSYTQLSEMFNVPTNKNSPILAEKLIVTLNETKACLQGVADASAKHVYDTLEPMLMGLGDLMSFLSNSQQIVEAILDLLCKLVTITYFLSKEASQKVYRLCMNCIQIYAKKNHQRVSLEATGEEDRLQDLMLLLKLMNHLLSKNFLDFGGDSPTSNDANQIQIDTAEVVVYGLESILPLITPDLLQYPNFCLQYYQTITFFLETKSHKVCSLQPEFLQKILNSVQVGLTNFSGEIQSLCLDFLQVMANTVYLDQNPTSYMYSALCPFLKYIMEMILGQQVGSENNVECGKALFSLMCVYKEQYVSAVQSMIQMQKNQADADRLQKEFTDLTTHIELINNRMTQFRFSEKFDKFLANIGFLFTI